MTNTLHAIAFQPDHYELSRHAAERHALLTAVQEKRSSRRRRARTDKAAAAPAAGPTLDGWFRRRRWS